MLKSICGNRGNMQIIHPIGFESCAHPLEFWTTNLVSVTNYSYFRNSVSCLRNATDDIRSIQKTCICIWTVRLLLQIPVRKRLCHKIYQDITITLYYFCFLSVAQFSFLYYYLSISNEKLKHIYVMLYLKQKNKI
jgi:hypothetical protein